MNSSHRSIVRYGYERAPIALLITIAGVQIVLALSQGLVAWKGGGFGMFATIDGPGLREVRAFDRHGVAIEIPSTLFEEERSARRLPSERALRALAVALASERELAEGAPATVEVWRLRWAGDPLRPERVRMARIELPPDG